MENCIETNSQNHTEFQGAFSFSTCLEHSSFIQRLCVECLYQNRTWGKRWGIGQRVEYSQSECMKYLKQEEDGMLKQAEITERQGSQCEDDVRAN